MTDRIHSITVVLEKDIREDDAECILNAIRMIKHVLTAKGNVSDFESRMAEDRARSKIHKQVFNAIYPEDEK